VISLQCRYSVCNEWLGKLSNIIKEYSPGDMFNVDETALFFKCLPDRTFILKGETCVQVANKARNG